MFTGGIGQIDDRHTEKKQALKGMIIVQVGGPAYRVGFRRRRRLVHDAGRK